MWANLFLTLARLFGYVDQSIELADKVKQIVALEAELAKEAPIDIRSPRDFIDHKKIDKIALMKAIGLDPRIKHTDVQLGIVKDSNSMLPMFDSPHTPMLIRLPQPFEPYRYEDLTVGDVIVFEALGRNIIHHIFSIEEDEQGRKYRTKGLHNARRDPWSIRDSHIKWVLNLIAY